MPKIRLGCQSITWGAERPKLRDHIIEQIAAAGYEGMESGARFLDLDEAAETKALLDANGLALAALHTGWNPFLGASHHDSADEFKRILDFAVAVDARHIVMSGRQGEVTPETMEGLNENGELCRQAGLSFSYHNHWWEIVDGAQVLLEIERRTDPALVGFCPDIGWVRKATPQVVETLRLIEGRIRLVHFKDYVSDDIGKRDDETEFGKGIMDFDGAFAFLQGLAVEELWVMAEQMASSEDHLAPEESIRANRVFLQKFAEW